MNWPILKIIQFLQHSGHHIRKQCSNILIIRCIVKQISVMPSFWCLIEVQNYTGSKVMASRKNDLYLMVNWPILKQNSEYYCTQGVTSKQNDQIYSMLDARSKRTVPCLHFGASFMFKLILEQKFQPLQNNVQYLMVNWPILKTIQISFALRASYQGKMFKYTVEKSCGVPSL